MLKSCHYFLCHEQLEVQVSDRISFRPISRQSESIQKTFWISIDVNQLKINPSLSLTSQSVWIRTKFLIRDSQYESFRPRIESNWKLDSELFGLKVSDWFSTNFNRLKLKTFFRINSKWLRLAGNYYCSNLKHNIILFLEKNSSKKWRIARINFVEQTLSIARQIRIYKPLGLREIDSPSCDRIRCSECIKLRDFFLFP